MKNFWKNKKVLVTGGAGFIGSHVVDELVTKNANVTVIVSPKSSVESSKYNLSEVYSRINVKKVDLLSLKDAVEAGKGQDIILNFAALDGGRSFKKHYPAQLFVTNVQIGLNILESARINNIKRVLLISSIEVYTKSAKNPITEDQGFLLDANPIEGYAWAKRVLEIAAKNYCAEYDMQIAIARLGNIYGPRDHMSKEKTRVVPNFIDNAMNGNPIEIAGNGSFSIPLLYVKDAAVGMLNLVEEYACAEPVNLVSSEYISLKKLAKTIKKLLTSSSKIEFKQIERGALSRKRIFSNAKAKKLINFTEKFSFEEGVKETIVYFQKQKR